jgi:hypothetical protein
MKQSAGRSNAPRDGGRFRGMALRTICVPSLWPVRLGSGDVARRDIKSCLDGSDGATVDGMCLTRRYLFARRFRRQIGDVVVQKNP